MGETTRIENKLKLTPGSGIPSILQAYGEESFKFSENFIRIIFPVSAEASDHASIQVDGQALIPYTMEKDREKSREKIMALMKEQPEIKQAELAASLQISVKAIEKHIKNLREQGIIRRIGPDKGGHWKIIKQE